MGFEKTYTDDDGDFLKIEAHAEDSWVADYSGVWIQTNEGAPNGPGAAVYVKPNRARKIALAILAAADEAEGVDSPSQKWQGDAEDFAATALTIGENGNGQAYVSIDGDFDFLPLSPKDAKKAALHLLRVVR